MISTTQVECCIGAKDSQNIHTNPFGGFVYAEYVVIPINWTTVDPNDVGIVEMYRLEITFDRLIYSPPDKYH